MTSDTLYYDGHCPLCTAEMARLKKLAGPELALFDIHELPDDTNLPPRNIMLESLHLQTRDSELLTGLDANVAAWQHTRFGFLWRWLRWPLIKPIADLAYNRWAVARYQRLYSRDAKS